MRIRPASVASFRKAEEREHRTQKRIARLYEPLIWPLIRNRFLGLVFLVSVIALTFWACSLFYTKTVTVKMLPFDNKPEFSVIINMPAGTALPVTANVAQTLTEKLRQVPEVRTLQTYVGTAQPFDFNGLVRHYYLRQRPWQADIHVMLLDKHLRERTSHQICVDVRHQLTPIARAMGARIQVVEMPPGPPVLDSIVAEVHGMNDIVRRQVAKDLTAMFEKAPNIVDVDNYMEAPHYYWRFVVDRQKATRQGVSVATINRNLAMAMGGFKLGDVKRAAPLEPTYIVIQTPLAVRSQLSQLSNLPIPTAKGATVPLGELGHFTRVLEDPVIYHKDLRPIEYVVGEGEGRLGAPIYGMFEVEDQLDDYVAPDGVKVTGMPWGLIGPPDDDTHSGMEWTGEWTVTYETFRDMGGAFMAALVLIYGLIVLEFKNYALAGLAMAPIPLTLIGIIPGHWIMGAQFTATSMIGMIALAGIIVRNSILIIEFVKNEVAQGREIRQAAVNAGRIRLRPIVITSLTVVVGAFAILSDPIFQGMAVSLLFGASVATLFTLIVIPMGCISAAKHFVPESCEIFVAEVEQESHALAAELKAAEAEEAAAPTMPLWMRIWSALFTVFSTVFYILRALFIMLGELMKKILGMFRKSPTPTPPPPPPTGGDGDGTPVTDPPPPPDGDGAGATVTAAATVDPTPATGAPSTSPTTAGEATPAVGDTIDETVGAEPEASQESAAASAAADQDQEDTQPPDAEQAAAADKDEAQATVAPQQEDEEMPDTGKHRGIRLIQNLDD